MSLSFSVLRNWFALGGAVVKNPVPMQETQVWSLGQEDPLEEEMATHSNILPGKTLWTEESGGLQPMGVTKSQAQLNMHTWKGSIYCRLENFYKQLIHGN